jgi:uncharacterized protein with GYD domain
VLLFATVVAISACGSVKNVVVKDIPLQEQEQVLNKYKDRHVWTRVTIHDMGDGPSIPRDEEVKIADVAMHYKGSVTVQTLKRKDKIVQGLELARPLTPEKIDAKLADLFWFDDPTIRQVKFIRKYGKKTAQAIMDHQLFAGMSPDAAMASWGPPMQKQVNEQGAYERWIYPTDTPKKTKALDLKDGKVLRWDE